MNGNTDKVLFFNSTRTQDQMYASLCYLTFIREGPPADYFDYLLHSPFPLLVLNVLNETASNESHQNQNVSS